LSATGDQIYLDSTTGAFRFRTTAGVEKSAIRLSGNDLIIEDLNGQEKVRVNTNGLNAVIGATTPAAGSFTTVAVNGLDPVLLQRPVIPSFGGQGAPAIDWRFYSTGTTYVAGASIQGQATDVWTASSTPTRIVFSTVPSGSTTLAMRASIDSTGLAVTGDAGIGTTTPDVFGRFYGRTLGLNSASSTFIELNAAFGSTAGIDFGVNGSRTAGITSNTTETQVTTLGATPLKLGTNSTTQATLDASGNLGLGVTPSGWGAGWKAIENLLYNSSYSTNGGFAGMANNAYYNGTNWIYRNTTYATRFESDLQTFKWFTAPSGTAGNAITFTQALTLEAAGHLLPGTTDNVENLGSATYRWATVYAGTGTINTSDAREKTEVAALTPAEINAAKQLSKEIGTYKFLTSVQSKGDAARTHVGMTVQRAIEIMESHGLSPFDYGFICFDAWEDKFTEHPAIDAVAAVEAVPAVEEVKDEDGNVITEAVPAIPAVAAVEGKAAWSEQTQWAGDRYAFRYDQLNLFIAAGIEARLAALEAA
jgi:hypothetical protein